MRLLAALIVLYLGSVLSGISQSSQDTVLLQEVVIYGIDPAKYLPGGSQQIIDSDSVPLENLTQVLERSAPIYFIQYGAPGQLSSINLRGLGAYRTSVQWHGMEINSFTLGQTDFSELMASNGDRVHLQYGGVGPVYGNGALGGTVVLEDNLVYNRGHGISLNTSFGSFGFSGIGINYRYSDNKWSSSTKLYRRSAENDFKYQAAGSSHRQQNAAFLHYGVGQDLKFRLNSNQQISMHFWFNNHFREIQPNKNDFESDEKLDTENTRLALKWQWTTSKWFGQIQAGYTNDYQLYNQSELTQLSRWYGSFESEWRGAKDLMVRLGGNLNHLIPEVDAYQGNTKETRSEIYGAVTWSRIKNLWLGLSLRTPMINGDFKAVTPMVSAKYRIHEDTRMAWSANFQYGQSYRIPTLNDLYWYPGGNPDLRPEVSNNLELGMDLVVRMKRVTLNMELQGFRHDVDDWIIWIPGGRDEDPDGTPISFWYPDNIREVLAFGVQYQNHIDWRLPFEDLKTSFSLDGTFNKSLNKNSISPVDRSKDKQLPYTPLHVINGHWIWEYKSWHVGTTMLYRSERYVETNNELPPLDAYTLWNFAAGKRGTIKELEWKLELDVNNATGKVYQTFENRAMPGRNYRVNLSLNFNK